MRSLIFLSLLISTLNSWAKQVPYRTSTRVINPKSYQVDVGLNYFSTIATFDKDGLEEELDEGTSLTMMDIDSNIRYGFGDQLELRVGFKYRQVATEQTSGNESLSLSNSGLESYWLGAKYAFKPSGRWRFAIDTRYKMTSYTNEEYAPGTTPAEEIILGDSGTEIQLGLHGSYQSSKTHFWNAYVAYNMPANNMSQEVVYFAETAWAYTKWGFRAGLKGVYSLGMDDFKDVPEDKPLQSSGPTAMFNSINRSWMTPYLGINYAFESFRLELVGAQRISGTSADKGMEALAKIVWNSKGVTRDELKISRFKEYEIEATIIKISPRKKFVKIDMGISQDVDKGMKMDIFQTDFFGGNVLVAQGVVYEVGADWAIIKILKRYKKTPIKNGFTARGY